MVFPFVAMFALAFVACMKLVLAEMALQQAVSQTVKLVSAHLYPAALAFQSAPGQRAERVISTAEDWIGLIEDTAELLEEADPHLPGQVGGWLAEGTEWLRRTADSTMDSGLGMIFLPLVKDQLEPSVWVDADQVRITNVNFPDLVDRERAYFGLSASYPVKIVLPFYQTTVNIEVNAYERVWLAG